MLYLFNISDFFTGLLGKELTLSAFYIICLIAGLWYSALLFLFGGGHGGADHTFDAAGDHGVQFSPFSPVSIAVFVSSFGAMGLIGLLGLHLQPFMCSVFSAAISLVISTGFYFAFYRFFILSQSSSVTNTNELINIIAEVITPIPEKGTGEVAYNTGRGRQTSPAKTEDGMSINKGEPVKIIKFVGNICYVAKNNEKNGEEN